MIARACAAFLLLALAAGPAAAARRCALGGCRARGASNAVCGSPSPNAACRKSAPAAPLHTPAVTRMSRKLPELRRAAPPAACRQLLRRRRLAAPVGASQPPCRTVNLAPHLPKPLSCPAAATTMPA